MPGKIIPPAPPAHVCTGKPAAEAYPRGTWWVCDECDKKWIRVEGSQYNERYAAWRVLTLRNANGSDN
jgi:hypothetical protein